MSALQEDEINKACLIKQIFQNESPGLLAVITGAVIILLPTSWRHPKPRPSRPANLFILNPFLSQNHLGHPVF